MSNDRDSRIAAMAARMLGLVMQHAQAHSAADDVAAAAAEHDARGLYPHLTISAPHGGGAVRVELTLRDPATDAVVVRMFEGEAQATAAPAVH
jgi:hypothetical protein